MIIYPICIFETIDKLGPFSLLGVAAVVYTAVVICYHGLVDPFHKGLENADPAKVAAAEPETFVFTLGSLQVRLCLCLCLSLSLSLSLSSSPGHF